MTSEHNGLWPISTTSRGMQTKITKKDHCSSNLKGSIKMKNIKVYRGCVEVQMLMYMLRSCLPKIFCQVHCHVVSILSRYLLRLFRELKKFERDRKPAFPKVHSNSLAGSWESTLGLPVGWQDSNRLYHHYCLPGQELQPEMELRFSCVAYWYLNCQVIHFLKRSHFHITKCHSLYCKYAD